MEFDVVIASPDAMKVVGQLGQILGPRGLMPNPKVGTVSADVVTAVKNAKAGQVQYRTDKAGIIHATIGRASFTPDQLKTNLKALIDALNKAKPCRREGHLPAQGQRLEHDGRGRADRYRRVLGSQAAGVAVDQVTGQGQNGLRERGSAASVRRAVKDRWGDVLKRGRSVGVGVVLISCYLTLILNPAQMVPLGQVFLDERSPQRVRELAVRERG